MQDGAWQCHGDETAWDPLDPARCVTRAISMTHRYGVEVAREPKSFRHHVVIVQYPDDELSWVRISPQTSVPERFRALIRLDEPDLRAVLTIRVDPSGRARVVGLEIETDQRDGAITTSLLRQVLIDPMLRAALRAAQHPRFPLVEQQDGQTAAAPSVAVDDRVIQAAHLYREALASGDRAPTAAVAAAMGYSRAQASRYIRAAREANPPLLPPARREG